MNTLYNNLVKSFSNSDWKSVKYYRDEIKSFSELSEVRNEIKENNGEAKLKEFDEELKKIKKKGKIKTALAIMMALAGIGLAAKSKSDFDKLAYAHNGLNEDFIEAKNNLYNNDVQLGKVIDDLHIPEEYGENVSYVNLKRPNLTEWIGKVKNKYE